MVERPFVVLQYTYCSAGVLDRKQLIYKLTMRNTAHSQMTRHENQQSNGRCKRKRLIKLTESPEINLDSCRLKQVFYFGKTKNTF